MRPPYHLWKNSSVIREIEKMFLDTSETEAGRFVAFFFLVGNVCVCVYTRLERSVWKREREGVREDVERRASRPRSVPLPALRDRRRVDDLSRCLMLRL